MAFEICTSHDPPYGSRVAKGLKEKTYGSKWIGSWAISPVISTRKFSRRILPLVKFFCYVNPKPNPTPNPTPNINPNPNLKPNPNPHFNRKLGGILRGFLTPKLTSFFSFLLMYYGYSMNTHCFFKKHSCFILWNYSISLSRTILYRWT